jgi:hypothetical protein
MGTIRAPKAEPQNTAELLNQYAHLHGWEELNLRRVPTSDSPTRSASANASGQ